MAALANRAEGGSVCPGQESDGDKEGTISQGHGGGPETIPSNTLQKGPPDLPTRQHAHRLVEPL